MSCLIQPRSFCTSLTVLFGDTLQSGVTRRSHSPCNSPRPIHDDTIEPGKRPRRADGEVFHHQPAAPCCPRFCGFRRPAANWRLPRLIGARSGIPERTASIPFAEKAYVVSLHLNHANSGEWELWTNDKYTKTGVWPVGGVAMCDLESNTTIRNPGPIDWIHYHVPRATLDSLSDDAGAPRAKRLSCVYGTPDPTLHYLTQTILPYLSKYPPAEPGAFLCEPLEAA